MALIWCLHAQYGLERYHMSLFVRMSCLLSGILLSANVMAAETEIIQPVAEMTLAQMEGEEEAAADADASMEGEAAMGDEASMGGEADAGAVAEAPADPAPAPAPVAEEVTETTTDAVAVSDGEVDYGSWTTEWHGYFRTPFTIGISKRPDPDNANSDDSLQGTPWWGETGHIYDKERNYSNFGFTRLQEGDWAQILITASHKHVAATVGAMGWWYQFVSKNNPEASWWPGLADVTLNTDFDLGGKNANIELKMGAFLEPYAYNGIYDTYLIQRSHLVGEHVKLTIPVSDTFTLALTHGFGANKTGMGDSVAHTLAHYANAIMNIGGKVDLGVYYNSSWTNDPTAYDNQETLPGTFEDYSDARMRVMGADVHLRLPKFGHLWAALNFITVKNGWALGEAIEVSHSPGGAGIASNYLPNSGTGSGSVLNASWIYENSIQGFKGKGVGGDFPDLTFTVFGMLSSASMDDVADGADDSRMQIKGGMDLTFWPKSWVGIMFRYDGVNFGKEYNITDANGENPEIKYHVFTPRVIFKSNFVSAESLWIQFSKYAFSDGVNDNYYLEDGPDALVFKMQANIGW